MHICQMKPSNPCIFVLESLCHAGMFKKVLLLWVVSFGTLGMLAGPYNIAPLARVTASSTLEGYTPEAVVDGIIRVDGKGEWASAAEQMFWGETDYPWIMLDWDKPVTINCVTLYDRPGSQSHTAGATLRFSDGSCLDVEQIPADGAPRTVRFPDKVTEWLKVEVTDGDCSHLGFSEIEVFPAPADYTDYVSYVDPYIETTRGRYFFFITGNQPQGMMGAAPMTRNKNQGGGGYNYNDDRILGFPQIHGWMLSGLEIMPVTGQINPAEGRKAWASRFAHEGEIVQPGYHRLYLEDHDVWVEQTATDRTSMYRFTYTQTASPAVLLNVGGYVGTSTMVNAHVTQTDSTRVEGYFDTVGRLWGGPDVVRVYFVTEFNRKPERVDAWNGSLYMHGHNVIHTDDKSVARNEGMSYHDAPEAGLKIVFAPSKAEPILMKTAISYVSIANAAENLSTENPGWNFDGVRKTSQEEWNKTLGVIDVKGGTDAQRIKFYTDMWHTLLGRHKIDDANGQYPDRTRGGRIEGKHVIAPTFAVGQLKTDANGKSLHHMYNSDALWLTQWNQNTLWGLAYPSLLDDFSASMVQYALNGDLLPRGPCGGGYSFIMSGCPATSMITSAYQRGLTHKWNPRKAYKYIRLNHLKGGMLSRNYESEYEFYEQNGYAPDRGGLTVEWAFEDWALSRMARKMGKTSDARRFEERSRGWRKCIHEDVKLLLPRRADGSWLHTDPLNGWGFEESNAWQTTFGLSHDIPGLAEAMGGADTLCRMLNYAMEQSRGQDFVEGYGNGYVSYANQPGLSTAHVFAHAGQPWLTQYWVREVKERAYGAITPSRGYGGHDEDQGQMSGVSALMAIGLFSINGGSDINPEYDITSPVFDEIHITLDPEYYSGNVFTIRTYNNSAENCYIQRASLNGVPITSFRLPHTAFAAGGVLEIWLGNKPNKHWGI